MTLRESYVSFCGGRLLAGRGYGLGFVGAGCTYP